MRTHVGEEATLGIPGTYRGALVTHCVHPQTGLHVIRDVQDALVSGWRLTPTTGERADPRQLVSNQQQRG